MAKNGEKQWLKTVKKLDSKLQKQRKGWPKILNTARKYNKDENLENYDCHSESHNLRTSTFWAMIG